MGISLRRGTGTGREGSRREKEKVITGTSTLTTEELVEAGQESIATMVVVILLMVVVVVVVD